MVHFFFAILVPNIHVCIYLFVFLFRSVDRNYLQLPILLKAVDSNPLKIGVKSIQIISVNSETNPRLIDQLKFDQSNGDRGQFNLHGTLMNFLRKNRGNESWLKPARNLKLTSTCISPYEINSDMIFFFQISNNFSSSIH